VFVVWNAEEYAPLGKQGFSYLGKIVFQNDAFVVFDVVQ
jgi:hypothetical protein